VGVAAAVGGLAAAVAVYAVVNDPGTNGDERFDALVRSDAPSTIECSGSVVELAFDPEAGIDARVDSVTVAAADVTRRGLSHTACSETPAQRGWDTRLSYETVVASATIVCRFPGRFFVHTHAVAPSWAGEQPAGSAVGLVLGRSVGPGSGPNRTVVATATVLERSGESQAVFAPRFCRAS
jgi:hypothetical protein